MFLYYLSNLGMGGGGVVGPALVVYIDPRSVQLYATGSDADPFGVDARSAQLIAASSDADPFAVDARSAQLIVSSADPYGVDARSAQLIS